MYLRIYQLPHNNKNIFRHFKEGMEIDIGDYCCVWFKELPGVIGDSKNQLQICEEVYTEFNINHPKGFGGHSLSVSDLVEIYDDEGKGHQSLYYCDAIGFKKISLQKVKSVL